MPIYEYSCQACGKAIEVMQKISDPAPTTCESCGKGPMEKQMSRSSFALKGTGWYVTDFRGGNSKPQSSGDSPASSPSTAPAKSGGGESK